jgi:1-deoxy-D-xylulose-5-phosphate synthase
MNNAATNILNSINTTKHVKNLTPHELVRLCEELRQRIVDVMSVNPGHFGASMGVVELTVALHYVLDLPQDALIWDVGHQCYAHKLLTQRLEEFETIRQFGSISGFPKRSESSFDTFGTGHSSTSISAAMGMALARQLEGDYRPSVAVIGDGALTGGMAFEALNHLGTTQANVLVIINDNDMSIDNNVGALQHHLQQLPAKVSIFELLNIPYMGVVDGHDVARLIEVLQEIIVFKGPQVLHVKTKKGKGYLPAEEGDATVWHAPGKFNPISGQQLKDSIELPKTYQQVVGETLVDLGCQNNHLMVVTPAMSSGSGLTAFAQLFPNRFFDVGIAEQHAITFSAGLAVGGQYPICVIYSTFLQRAYDQLIHDVALQNLNILFLIDRAGLVGNDGATHHGMFDLTFLSSIPNMTLLVPSDEILLQTMIKQAVRDMRGPVAIRYPRGRGVVEDCSNQAVSIDRCVKLGREVAIISIGTLLHSVRNALELIEANWSLYDLQWAKPLPEDLLHKVFSSYTLVITLEDGVIKGGIGASIAQWKTEQGYIQPVYNWGLPDAFIEHGSQEQLYESIELNVLGLKKRLEQVGLILKNIKT